MGAELRSTIQDKLESFLDEADGRFQRGQWQVVVEQATWLLQQMEEEEQLEASNGELIPLLVLSSKLCNRLLRIDLAKAFLEAAERMCCTDTLRTSILPDLVPYKLQTELFAADVDYALGVLEKADVQRFLQSVDICGVPNDVRRLSLKRLLLDLASVHQDQQDFVGARCLLQTEAFSCKEAESFDQQCAEAERYSRLACIMHGEGKATTGMFNRALHHWKTLHWPLNHADVILETMIFKASHSLQKERGAEALRGIKRLEQMFSKLWCHGGLHVLVASKLYDLGSYTADTLKNHEMAIHCGKMGLRVLLDASARGESDLRTMYIGVTHYMLGLSYLRIRETQTAFNHFRESVSLLEQCAENRRLAKQYPRHIGGTLRWIRYINTWESSSNPTKASEDKNKDKDKDIDSISVSVALDSVSAFSVTSVASSTMSSKSKKSPKKEKKKTEKKKKKKKKEKEEIQPLSIPLVDPRSRFAKDQQNPLKYSYFYYCDRKKAIPTS